MKVSIIIPVFNEAGTIATVIERVRALDLGAIEKEIVLVDDGSDDGSAAIVRAAGEGADGSIVSHVAPLNLGKGAAVRMGLRIATGDVVAIQDADLELDPNDLPVLLRPIADGEAEVVYGSRFLGRRRGRRVPLRRRLANGFLTTLTNVLFRSRLTDMETAYKVFRADVLTGTRLRCVGFDIEPEITAAILKAGRRIHEVPVRYDPRGADDGKKISWRDGIAAVYTLVMCRLP
jgi:glycosyltransferase involved in cell wall biosynthesis